MDLPGNQKELEALCRSVTRGVPFGEDGWVPADGTPASPGIEPARPAPAKEKEGKWREVLLTPFIRLRH